MGRKHNSQGGERMDMVSVFEEKVIKKTEQDMQQAITKLKTDEVTQQRLRELTVLSSKMDRINYLIQELTSYKDKEDKKEWLVRRDKLRLEINDLYFSLKTDGFENNWVDIIVSHEKERWDKISDTQNKNIREKYFPNDDLDDIVDSNEKLEILDMHIGEMTNNYIKGNYEF